MEFQNLDQQINQIFAPIADSLSSAIFYSVPIMGVEFPLILMWLVAASLFFTLYLNFISIRGFRHAVRLTRGDFSDPNHPGEISHFQALASALSGTIGLGNIAGVAIGISIGGPGATFWMILAGFLGMSAKFAECTMGTKYRRVNADGTISGGPMYYLRDGFAARGFPALGKFLAVFFAVCCIGGALGGGNMFQVNQAFQQFLTITGGAESFFADKAWLFGLAVAVVVGMVIIGGIKSIARVTEKLVPGMVAIYMVAGIAILVVNAGAIPDAFAAIFNGAFTGAGVTGGVIGALIQGMRRAAFSNEAGIGSAAIAHSSVRTKDPVTEGLVSLLEPFIDTVVICTMTALIIVTTGAYMGAQGLTGVQMTSAAFASVLPWFPYVLGVVVILFALATLFTWSYYGLKAWTYLVGENKFTKNAYNLVFCLFAIVGASMNLTSVIDFSDGLFFIMGLANIIGLYAMAPEIKRDLERYWNNRPDKPQQSNNAVPPSQRAAA